MINVLKILRAEGTSAPSGWTMNGRPMSEMSRWGVAGFFSFHYGLFWVVHGAFVLTAIPAMVLVVGKTALDLAFHLRQRREAEVGAEVANRGGGAEAGPLPSPS